MCSIFSEAEGTTWNLKSYKFITFDEKLNFEKKTYNIHKNTVTIEWKPLENVLVSNLPGLHNFINS